nr:beta-galactoside alpha-2,6-sialyltransferase 1 [Onthophagus taurus]
MRALAVTVWVFINLLFFGMCGYMYLLWSQYWLNSDKDLESSTNNYDQQIYLYNRGFLVNDSSKYDDTSTSEIKNRIKHSSSSIDNITVVRNSKPRFPNVQKSEFIFDSKKFVCKSNDSKIACNEKTQSFKDKLINEMKRVFLDEGNVLKPGGKDNSYNVNYQGPRENYMEKSQNHMLCELRNVKIDTIQRRDVPSKLNSFKGYFPNKGIFEDVQFKSCAVISSAGSFTLSGSGRRIDSYEVVLRFNNAPTKGFEIDVGQKTTIRIVNSQVMSKQEFDFLRAAVFRNVTILGWDPSNYTSTVEEWFQNPEYNLFPNYIGYKRMFPESEIYIMNPQSIWKVWDFLQSNSPNRLRRNPPSSGFLGITLLLSHCDFVDAYEYIPSVRITKRCHYYEPENNQACTFGVWHPLAAEKLLTYYMNEADDRTVFQDGYVRIPGFNKLNC